MSERSARVVIVGGGILGSAVAYALATQGEKDVLVLESESDFDQHSTGRSAAYFIPMYESVAYAELSKASLGFLKNPPSNFSDRPIFRRDGAVIAAAAGSEANLHKEIADARGLGMEVTQLDGDGIKRLVPVVRTDKIALAAYYPDAGEIDVAELSESFRRGAKDAGARFVTGEQYRGARSVNGRVVFAITNSSEIKCEVIVNASGAWVGEVASLSNATSIVPLVLRRHLLKAQVNNVPKGARWPFFRCPSLPLYFKVSDGELAFSPMDAVPTPVGPCEIDQAMVEKTLSTLNEYTDLNVDPHTVKAVAGHRVFGADHQPLIGPDPKLAGFYWAGGMGGAGIMASPAVGEMVSAAILGKPSPINNKSSMLDRFIGQAPANH